MGANRYFTMLGLTQVNNPQSLTFPTPPTVAPTSPGTPLQTFNPSLGSAASGPAISEMTRIANKNELVFFTGDGFSSGLYFIFYGQTTAGDAKTVSDVTQSRLLKLVGNTGAYAIPNTLPADSAYLVVPIIGANMGTPFLLNVAEVRWTQDMVTGLSGSACPTNPISVYGINLATTAGATRVHLKVTTGTPAEMDISVPTVINTDGSMVQFTMPVSISGHGNLIPGDNIEVWIQARGGNLGWSKSPTDITITTLAGLNLDWSLGTQTQIAAQSGSSTSQADTDAFKAAKNTINGTSGTITFPTGVRTYYFDSIQPIAGGSNCGISVDGQGVDVTILKPLTSGITYSGGGWLLFNNLGRMRNLTIDTTGVPMDIASNHAPNGAIRVPYFDNVKFICPDGKCVVFGGNPGVGKSSTLTGFIAVSDSLGAQRVLKDLTIIQTSGLNGLSDAGIQFNAAHELSVINVTETQGSGEISRGRPITIETEAYNYYIDNLNSTLTPIVGNNGGEQLFLGEATSPVEVTGATSDSTGTFTTVTFATTVPVLGGLVQTVDGKGIGQDGRVTAVNVSTVTLDMKWRVDINTSSTLHYTGTSAHGGTSWGIVRNSPIIGGGVVSGSASTGWQIYQGSSHTYFFNNQVTACNRGYNVSNNSNNGTTKFSVNHWMLVKDTLLSNCGNHEQINLFGAQTLPSYPVNLGVLMRRTTGTGPGITTTAITEQNSSANLIGHDACTYTDAGSGMRTDTGGSAYESADIMWNTSITPGAAVGTTHGLDPAGGFTGANILVKGTGGVSGFTDHNKLPS